MGYNSLAIILDNTVGLILLAKPPQPGIDASAGAAYTWNYGAVTGQKLSGATMAAAQIQSISHRHEAIADWLLVNPEVKNLEVLCDMLHVSRTWLSIVMNSDVFKEYFAKRRDAWEGDMHDKIRNKQLKVTLQAYDRLENILCDEEVDPRLVLDITTKTTERLGFTPQNRRTTVTEERIQEAVRPVDAGVLGNARELLKRTVTTTFELPAPKP